jgi:hypothetical protein
MPKKLLKNVSFRHTEDEIKLLDHANSKRNFSEWVKQKLEEDLFSRRVVVENKDNIVVDESLF